jgi:rhodanese-related sulfurtransferase
MSQKKNKKRSSLNTRSGLSTFLRKPAVQGAIVLFVAFIIYLIATAGGSDTTAAGTLAREVSVDKAYEMYQSGVFVVDVRTQEEWDEYHAPNTNLIPLDELQARLSEVPKDQEIRGRVPLRESQPAGTRYPACRRVQRNQHDRRFEGMVRQGVSC